MGIHVSKNQPIQDYKRTSQRTQRPGEEKEKEDDSQGQEKQNKAIRSYQHQKEQSLKHGKILHARDVCSSPVITLPPEARVNQALDLMHEYQIHHIPVIDKEGIIIGIVSDRDLYSHRKSERLERCMTIDPITARENIEVKLVAKIMITNGISALPLLSDQNYLVGIITKTDLLECLVRSLPVEQYV